MIKAIETQGTATSFMELSVTIEGRTVTIGAGAFGVGRTLYALPEDNTFTLDVMPHRCALAVYLVQEKATGAVSVLVDDAPHGDSYKWERNDPHTNLYMLMLADIPPNTEDLDGIEVQVFRRIKPQVSNG